jgi:pyrroloquinoline quinone (PQQ) biosynthesis protein C
MTSPNIDFVLRPEAAPRTKTHKDEESEISCASAIGGRQLVDSTGPRAIRVAPITAPSPTENPRSVYAESPVESPELSRVLVNIRDIRTEKQGCGELKTSGLSARDFVEELSEQSLLHQAVNHPYLEALSTGENLDTRWALTDFAQQYYGYSKDFPRYLTAVISRLEEPRHRTGLMQNLTEESGVYQPEELAELAEIGIEPEWIVGQPHPLLFGRFSRAMGVRAQGLPTESDQITCWREMFLALLTNGTPAEAVGALGLGTENIVSTIYQPFSNALARLPDLHPRDTVFFALHTAVDDDHQETLQRIAADLAVDAASRSELRRGMLKALCLRSSFWDWMYRRALNPELADQIL